MHTKNIHTAGKNLTEAEKALIMVHGRGGNAKDILSLASHLPIEDYAILAPEATNNTWYPYSFLAPSEQNEPWLSSGLNILQEVVNHITVRGIETKNIYFLGFSQGACLTLEYIGQNAKRYGGVAAFTGGFIGGKIDKGNYSGNFEATPIFIGTGNPDPHVPLERAEATAQILEEMNAGVTLKIYENKPHSISEDEIEQANRLIFNI